MEYLVSVLIPTFNRAASLKRAIKSVQMQTYKYLEIIISDNFSSDNTELVVRGFQDQRIKYYKNKENIGPILNWRQALENANGDFGIILCDDDYFIDDNYIMDAVSLFLKYNSAELVITDCILGTEEPRTTYLGHSELIDGIEFFNNFWTSNFYIPTISNMFRIGSVLKVDAWLDNEILYSDIELWLKLMMNGDIAYINRPTVYYNFHGKNIVTTMGVKHVINNVSFINNICTFMEKQNTLSSQIAAWRSIFLTKYINFIVKVCGIPIDYEAYKEIYIKVGEKPYLDNYLDLSKNNLTESMNSLYKIWFDNLLQNKGITNVLHDYRIENVAIFGTMKTASYLYEDLKRGQFNIVCFLDNNISRRKQTMYDINICFPNELDPNTVDAIILSIEGNHDIKIKAELSQIFKNQNIRIFSWKELIKISLKNEFPILL